MQNGEDAAYFKYYGQIQYQQNMLMDHVRTSTYYKAIVEDGHDFFKDKIVLDVGCGSGILGFFAVQAGARHVYSVDAAKPILAVAQRLAESNGYTDRMTFIEGKIEDIQLPEQVDIIVSEPIGIVLLHERMCESFVLARQRWLKPYGLVFPNRGIIKVAPFTDGALYADTMQKAQFWQSSDFYGVNLAIIQEDALNAGFSQPIVGGFDKNSLFTRSSFSECTVDFDTCSVEDIQNVRIELQFKSEFTGVVHGLATWFDLVFPTGGIMSTAPQDERTHWHQVRFLLRQPLAVNRGESIEGAFQMRANEQRSFDVSVSLQVASTGTRQSYALQDHYYGNLGQVNETSVEYHYLYQ